MRLAPALCGLALLIVSMGALVGPAAAEDRTLTFKQMHTGETLTVTYKRNGRFDQAALKKINYILRDWRRNESTTMDPELIDLIWEVRRDLGSRAAVHVLSGYRSPVTNAALRQRTSGVAKYSQHMLGKATDFYLPDVKLSDLRRVALREQVGGVGFYPTSGSPFVHLDTGRVRHWPRMTRQQLAQVFPDGKTLHIPSDGKPLEGYQVALAEAERRKKSGGSSSGGGRRSLLASLGIGGDRRGGGTNDDPSRPVASGNGGGTRNFFAELFNGGEDDDEAQATGQEPAPQPTIVANAPAAEPKPEPVRIAAADAPLPPARPDLPGGEDGISQLIASNDAALDAARETEPAAQQAAADVPLPPVAPAPDPVVVAGIVPPSRPLIQAPAPAAPAATIVPNIVTALAPTGGQAGRELPFDRTFTGGTLGTSIHLVPMDLRVEVVDAVANCASVWLAGKGLRLRHPDQRDLSPLFANNGEVVENRFAPRKPVDYANRFKGAPIGHVEVTPLKFASLGRP